MDESYRSRLSENSGGPESTDAAFMGLKIERWSYAFE